MPTQIKNKILTAVLIFIVTISIGIFGYKILAPQSSSLDALYMTIITLSTVGYGEVIDLTENPSGKVFTMILILFGMGNLLFVVTTLTSFITDGELKELLRKRRMLKMIDKLQDHIVVCGSGIMVKRIVQELMETNRQFVFVSAEADFNKKLSEKFKDLLHIDGDPSHNNTLLSANIAQAKGLISVLPDDRDNLLVIVTAKNLNKDIRVVASVNEPEDIDKFKTVGVDITISPNLIGGLRIVSEMIRPSVTTFLDVMLRDKSSNTRFEDVLVHGGSYLANKTIRDAQIKERTGLLIISLQKADKTSFVYNPSGEDVISEGMSIITIGSVEQVSKLRELAGASA